MRRLWSSSKNQNGGNVSAIIKMGAVADLHVAMADVHCTMHNQNGGNCRAAINCESYIVKNHNRMYNQNGSYGGCTIKMVAIADVLCTMHNQNGGNIVKKSTDNQSFT
jgi:hypothetical protein